MYCRKCGKEIPDGAKFCPNCGEKTDDTTIFVPIAGLILFLVWKDEKPEDSKASGIGALVSVVVSIIIFLLYIIALPAFLV